MSGILEQKLINFAENITSDNVEQQDIAVNGEAIIKAAAEQIIDALIPDEQGLRDLIAFGIGYKLDDYQHIGLRKELRKVLSR